MNLVKKVAAIHDLSGYGRASLTTIIPILSTMKLQVCPIPTAILSTHTGGFEGYSFMDLTDYMQEHINHWKKLNLEFDCIYSGFLGSPKQAKIVEDFIDYFKNDNQIVLVDPVMGDDGKLYGTMSEEMVKEMRELIKKADIITPNFTEVTYLLGKPYDTSITLEEIKKYLVELSNMGPKIVIATSIPDKDEIDKKVCVVAYDKVNDVFWKVSCKHIPASYPGTGDAYASVIAGCLLRGDSLPIAMERAMLFITQAIRTSYGFNYPTREGVLLENVLGFLNSPFIATNYEKI